MKRPVLYIIIAVLVLLLVGETGYLLTRDLLSKKDSAREAPRRDRFLPRVPPARPDHPPGSVAPRPGVSRPHDPIDRLWYDAWDPFEEMERMRAGMDEMFRDGMGSFEPDLDMREMEHEYIVQLDLPGIDKDKVRIKAQDHTLTISGEREFEKERTDSGGF